MTKKQLAKISHVKFGFGGYQEAQFGLSLTFTGDGWGCGTFLGHWADEPLDGAKWTDQSRKDYLGDLCLKIAEYCRLSKVKHVAQLAGIPVEVTFTDGKLESWRILTEVL